MSCHRKKVSYYYLISIVARVVGLYFIISLCALASAKNHAQLDTRIHYYSSDSSASDSGNSSTRAYSSYDSGNSYTRAYFSHHPVKSSVQNYSSAPDSDNAYPQRQSVKDHEKVEDDSEAEQSNATHPDDKSKPSQIDIIERLEQELKYYQGASMHPLYELPEGPALKWGSRSNNVLLLRQHLQQSGDLAAKNDVGGRFFDVVLAEAVKNFQRRHGLTGDGVVGKRTREEINIPPQVRILQIQANIERWKNLLTLLQDRYILVNVPEFRLYLVDNKQLIMTMKAIVGKLDRPTPELNSKITRIILNPYWDVPAKIAAADIVPKIMENPNYLEEMNMRVFTSDGKSSINHHDFDWQDPETISRIYHFRQEPGSDNALGSIKFEFPNRHNVYLHDTPHKDLFANNTRTYSSGCIRLENPFALAYYLLQNDPIWNPSHIQDVVDSRKTTYIKLQIPIPIIVTYITVWVDSDGNVNYRSDIYNRDNGLANSENEDDDDIPGRASISNTLVNKTARVKRNSEYQSNNAYMRNDEYENSTYDSSQYQAHYPSYPEDELQ